MSTAQGTGVKKALPGGNAGTAPKGKLLRLRGRTRPLFESSMSGGQVTEKEADVLFVCENGKILPAHKVVLAVSSKFFCQIFADQTSKKPTIVHVPDVSIEVMRLILLLCYKDNVNIPLRIMKEIGTYLSMFGLGLDKFNVGEATVETKAVTMPKLRQSVPTPGTSLQQQQQQNQQRNKSLNPQSLLQPKVGMKPNVQLINVGGKLYTASTSVASGESSQSGRGNSQTYVLDANSVTNGGTVPDDDSEYAPPAQSIRLITQQKEISRPQPRPILPKPQAFIQQNLQRSREGPPVLQRMNTSPASSHPEAETPIEVEMGDEDMEQDSEDAQQMLQHWMANVGKPAAASAPPRLIKVAPLKQRSPGSGTSAGSGFLTSPPPPKLAKRQCSICRDVFDTDQKYRWHQDRHIGTALFKCLLCDGRFTTARKVYQHEMMEHNHMENFEQANQPLIGHVTPGEDRRRITLYKNASGQFSRRVSGLKSAVAKRKAVQMAIKKPKIQPMARIPTFSRLHQNFASKNPLIGIGVQDGEDLIEARKLKQLHWLYVCSKCENCADSTAKAIAHYKQCYPDREVQFEASVTKYRQGFYGKIRCPLCPRRYTSLAGFLIHCGHMHQEYRRIFSHLNYEDKMMCVNCREKFNGPSEFHNHLNKFNRCDKNNQQDEPGSSNEVESGANMQSYEESRQKQYTKLLGKNPRSQRLQNRLAAVTACFEDDPNEANEDDFDAVTCPICGEAEIPNVAIHLHEAHEEMQMRIERIETETLRCKDCAISFALCDLLAHSNSCTESKGMNYVARLTPKKTYAPKTPPAPKPKVVIEYPPGIGKSPIETMDNPNLMLREVLEDAMVCAVCKRTGKKMNVIAECLRAHGIWRCAICFNTYMSKEEQSSHLKTCHGVHNSYKLTCPICNVIRANAGQLASHMHNMHWLPLLRGQIPEGGINKQGGQEQSSAGADDSKEDALLEGSIDEGMDASFDETTQESENVETHENSDSGLPEIAIASAPTNQDDLVEPVVEDAEMADVSTISDASAGKSGMSENL